MTLRMQKKLRIGKRLRRRYDEPCRKRCIKLTIKLGLKIDKIVVIPLIFALLFLNHQKVISYYFNVSAIRVNIV
jgi:hypothetical protein